MSHGGQWMVYPTDRTNYLACVVTNYRLSTLLGSAKVERYSSSIRRVTEFWLVIAEGPEVNKLREITGVRVTYSHSTL